jgi:hypothetical protein
MAMMGGEKKNVDKAKQRGNVAGPPLKTNLDATPKATSARYGYSQLLFMQSPVDSHHYACHVVCISDSQSNIGINIYLCINNCS